MNTGMKRANAMAGEVYSRFMAEVLEKHVLTERAGGQIGEELKKNIQAGKSIDPRVIYLMSISGKGGWDDDAGKRERYLKNQNVTLLDHLLSVVRGALMLAALDWLLENPEMDEGELRQRLTVIAAIAFLHDLDKMLQLLRDEELTLLHVDAAVKHYGITAFLASVGVELSSDQIRFLIEQAEDSQRYRHPAVIAPPRAYKHAVERYVKLADKLDGLWQEHGAQGGLEAIIQRLQQEQSFNSALLAQWETVDVFDPHHPFLLDELQRRLSFACQRIAGIPPLLEVHQDGRLFMLLPKAQADKIKLNGLNSLKRLLGESLFELEICISNRGLPQMRNGQPNHSALQEHLQKLDAKTLSQLFLVSNELIKDIIPHLDSMLRHIGLQPRLSKTSGQTSSLYPNPDEFEISQKLCLLRAAHLALLLNLKLPVTKKNGLPNYVERESQLLELMTEAVPAWIECLDDKYDQYKRVLLSLWIMSVAYSDEKLTRSVWGEDGKLKCWLEGTDDTSAFLDFFEGEGVVVQQAVEMHFSQLLNKQRIIPVDESFTGRCLFTDEPANITMESNFGLYEVKVSAFSGRDGRPDTIAAPANGQVTISYVSLAEHKLRGDVYFAQTGKRYKQLPGGSGVPTIISSPVMTGLFGALILNDEQSFQALSVYQLATRDKTKIHYRGLEAYRHRYRMARLERIPEKTEDQINMLRLLLSACLRIGRPIHVFRGLPTPQKAFFYFDAMPPVLKALLGYHELRLEQIPTAIANLNMAQILVSTPGLGYDVLNLYAFQRTRFSAICLAWCHARDELKHANNQKTGAMKQLEARFLKEFHQLEEQQAMSDSDGALVRLGRAATRIQQRPIGQISTNVEMRVFKICLDSALALRSAGQTDPASLIHGIAGELEINLVRKNEAAARKHRDEQSLETACMDFASQFVHEVWIGVLHGKPPAQKTRRLLGSVYRMAFLQAFRNTTTNETNQPIEDTATLEPAQGELL